MIHQMQTFFHAVPRFAGILLLAAGLWMQAPGADLFLEVQSIEGKAKLQRAQKRTWEDIGRGRKIGTNDIIETYFQTKCVLVFDKTNVIILGSNSRVLFTLGEKDVGDKTVPDISVTLFAGGAFAKIVSDCHISIFTATAVSETDKGAISSVTDEKTGETGFQILDGSAGVRNIAQHESRILTSGQTTMIFPGKQPTLPLYITVRHVAVLKHFFGDEYIQNQLTAAGIKPTEDKSASKARLATTENAVVQQQQQKARTSADEGFYKPLFNLNKIYGHIIDDDTISEAIYRPVVVQPGELPTRSKIAITGDMALAAGKNYQLLSAVGSYDFSVFDFGLRFALGSTAMGFKPYQLSGKGLLDLVHHADLSVMPDRVIDSLGLHLGGIEDLTIGNGLVVENYTNKNPASLFHPFGLTAAVNRRFFTAQAFMGDLFGFSPCGLLLQLDPSLYHFRGGYYFDMFPLDGLSDDAGTRFVLPDSLPASNPDIKPIHLFELGFGADLAYRNNFKATLSLEMAHGLFYQRKSFLMRMPRLDVTYHHSVLGASLLFEEGGLMLPLFSSFYSANRVRLLHNGIAETPTSMLSVRSKSRGVEVFAKVNPWRGMALEAMLRHDFFIKGYVYDTTDLAYFRRPNFDLSASVGINDRLVRFIKYARVAVSQIDGAFFPAAASYGKSWGFKGSFDFSTASVGGRFALLGGASYYYLDLSDAGRALGMPNNAIDTNDKITEFYAGLVWGFF